MQTFERGTWLKIFEGLEEELNSKWACITNIKELALMFT